MVKIKQLRTCLSAILVGVCLGLSACSTQQVVRNSIDTAALGLAVVEFESRYQQTSGLLQVFKTQFSQAEWQTIVSVVRATDDIHRSARRLLSAKGNDQQKSLTALISATRELNFYYRQAYVQLKPRMAHFPLTLQRELVAFHQNIKRLEQSYHNLTRNQSDEVQQIIHILQIAANGLVVFGVRDEIDHSTRY